MKKIDLDKPITRRDFVKMGIASIGISSIYSIVVCWWLIKPWMREKVNGFKKKFLNRDQENGE